MAGGGLYFTDAFSDVPAVADVAANTTTFRRVITMPPAASISQKSENVFLQQIRSVFSLGQRPKSPQILSEEFMPCQSANLSLMALGQAKRPATSKEPKKMPTIEISDATNARLQGMAMPLVDTYETVITRLLDAFEKGERQSHPTTSAAPGAPIGEAGQKMEFDWRNAPSLTHTTITSVNLDGNNFVKSDTYWNTILLRVIEAAHKNGMSKEAIFAFLKVNKYMGEKTINGFKYVPDVGISFQNGNSETAFRQIFDLASHCGMKLELHFRWQGKEDAAYPNREGFFRI